MATVMMNWAGLDGGQFLVKWGLYTKVIVIPAVVVVVVTIIFVWYPCHAPPSPLPLVLARTPQYPLIQIWEIFVYFSC